MKLTFCPNCGGPLERKAPERDKPSLVFYNCKTVCRRSWFILTFEELVEQKVIVA